MSTVRSLTIIAQTVAAGATAAYTVPAGMTLILKSSVVYNAGTAAGGAIVELTRGANGQTMRLTSENPGVNLTIEDTHYVVLSAGDTITCAALIQPHMFWVSGSLLSGIAPS